MINLQARWLALALAAGISCAAPQAVAADLPRRAPQAPAPVIASGWTVQFTPYAWLPWVSGDVSARGRTFNLDVPPSTILNALDGKGIPAWMSYAEARNGPFAVFADVVFVRLSESASFARARQGVLVNAGAAASLRGTYTQTIAELGAAYEVARTQSTLGTTSFDVLGGIRYWQQDLQVSASVTAWASLANLSIEGTRAFARSGNVQWADPFVGVRVRHQFAPGHGLTLRGDIGGFGAGSDFSWHAIATYDVRLFTGASFAVDGYIGYKALSADYTKGSGATRYTYHAVQHGPVAGVTFRF
jgi:hypothetical protein